MKVEDWLYIREEGLYAAPGDVFIDPLKPVERALITHGHADHARPGHGKAWGTPETLGIMTRRYGDNAGRVHDAHAYGEAFRIGDLKICLAPAGHVLGSAQIILEYNGQVAVAAGDYKRTRDPTCAPFQPVPCDVFITEATFALPVFKHPEPEKEMLKLIQSLSEEPDRAHLLGCYGLGKCQRLIALLREARFSEPIWLHGALIELCRYYEECGVDLGDIRPVAHSGLQKEDWRGQLIMAPPSALREKWARRFPDPLVAMASGWMRVRQRAKQRGVELPMIVSDHVDWPDLLQTIADVDPEEVWITHGREDALIHALNNQGRRARALRLIGFEEEDI